ncbi:MAG: C39 family peptidase [Clostridium sp.]|uniref:C39 family peptidase n=1 Tax=Clostridium sp. TaxID=1506 RepID=UPI003074FB25
MKKKNLAITLIIGMAIILVAGVVYIKVSNPKFEDLDPSWGMGTKVTEAVSNDRDYYWYVDQWTTGKFGYINCGPTSIEMVAKWQNKDSDIKAEVLRDKYVPEVRGVSTYELYNWATDYDIKVRWLNVINQESLKDEINKGNLVIVGLYLGDITYNPNKKERVGKYFDVDYPHYVIVKGYKVVDEKLYFETYDAYSSEQRYDDSEFVGMNRYYLAEEFIKSANAYWSEGLVVENLD